MSDMFSPLVVFIPWAIEPRFPWASLSRTEREQLLSHFFLKQIEAEPVVCSFSSAVSPEYAMDVCEFFRLNAREVALDIDGGFVVLTSRFPQQGVVRPLDARMHPEILTLPTDIDPIKKESQEVSLEGFPEVTVKNYMDVCFRIKTQLAYTKQVIFSGSCDSKAAVLAYTLWLPYADKILYSLDQHICEIL